MLTMLCQKAKGTAARLMAEANAYKVSIENEALGNSSRFEQILKEYERAPELPELDYSLRRSKKFIQCDQSDH